MRGSGMASPHSGWRPAQVARCGERQTGCRPSGVDLGTPQSEARTRAAETMVTMKNIASRNGSPSPAAQNAGAGSRSRSVNLELVRR